MLSSIERWQLNLKRRFATSTCDLQANASIKLLTLMISDSFQVDQNQADFEQSSKQNLAHDDEMR